MPPHSRAQRRRQAARKQGRPAASASSAEAASRAPSTGATVPLAPPERAESRAARPAPPERAEPRAARPARRVLTRPAPEPIDYSKDYTAVRRDLRWIALWTVLLFVGMLVLRFSGLV